MDTGFRAEVTVDSPTDCPIAQVSGESGASTQSVVRTAPVEDGTVTEEFMLDGATPESPSGMESVVSYGDKQVYRFERARDRGCACEAIEASGCPVVDVHARDGALHLVFHAADLSELRGVVDDLQDQYANVHIRRLLHEPEAAGDEDLVFVDRGCLTDRQREVIKTAHEMGYFDHPKRANAGDVADALSISRSTFSEHLAAAQRKVLSAIVSPEPDTSP